MKIDILTPPISSRAIDEERSRLNGELARLKKKKKATLYWGGWYAIALIGLTVALNAYFDFLPWEQLAIVAGVNLYFAIWVATAPDDFTARVWAIAGVVFSIIVAAAVIATSSVVAIVFVANAVTFAALAAPFFIIRKIRGAIYEIRQSLEKLEPVEDKSCIEILEWKTLPEIEDFVRSVVADQDRKLILAEFKAAKQFHESRTKQIKIDAACKEVYMTPLVAEYISPRQ